MSEGQTGQSEVPAASKTGPAEARWRRADWWVSLCLVVASLLVGLIHVPQHVAISPIDEFVYIDYLAKVPSQGVVVRGEETGAFAREFFACHGVLHYFEPNRALCESGSFENDSQFPFDGKTSADLYSPLYFYVTWVVAQPLRLAGVDLVDAGRMSGTLWLAGALVLFYAATRRFGVDRRLGLGIGLLLAGSLPAYWSQTYISTDATALFAGSLVLFLGLNYLRGRGHWWVLPAAAAVVTLLKLQNMMPVMCIALLFFILAAREIVGNHESNRRDMAAFFRHRLVLTALATIGAALLVQVAWTVIRAVMAVGPAPDQLVAQPLGARALVSEMIKFLPGSMEGATDAAYLGIGGTVIAGIGVSLVAAGVIGVAATGKRELVGTWLAVAALIVAAVAGPALALANLAVSGFYFPLPARYGMSLIPIFLVCACLLITGGRLRNVVTGVGVGLFALSLTIV